MIGFGMLGRRHRPGVGPLVDQRKGRTPTRALARCAPRSGASPCCRSLANSFGWIFTEMGRQPWVVTDSTGLTMLTRDGGVSRGVSADRGAHLRSSPSPSSTPRSPSSSSGCCCATPRPAARRRTITAPADDTDDAERPLAFAY